MKRIVVIGASSGIGRKVARDFAAAGWAVGIAARREQPLRELAEEYPDRIKYRSLDVTSVKALHQFDELVADLGGMDILLYASGTGFIDPELTEATTQRILLTNVCGFARMISHAYKWMQLNRNISPGLIAAITSIAGTKGIGIAAAYSASKRFQRTYIDALDQLAHSQHAAVEFCDIRPGFVDTALLSDASRYPMVMSVDEAAVLVEHALLKRRRVATIDWRWRAVDALWSLIPQCVWRHIGFSSESKLTLN